jgi:hypothetical protein
MKRNDDTPSAYDTGTGANSLRNLSPLSFAALGTGQVAYVRPAEQEGNAAYAVCSADGQELAVVAARDVAFALIRQNDLEPVSVH